MPRGGKRRRESPPAAAAAATSPRAAPAPKQKRTYDAPCAFLRTWLWKRESKSDEERFDQPYCYPFGPDDDAPLRIEQRRFGPEGFASTVWDSSIVLSKYLERRFGAGPEALAGVRAVELGAGCGLVSCVLARLGADVTATDMEANLPLLRDNLRANLPQAAPPGAGVRVAPLLWGADAARRVAAAAPDRADDAHCLRASAPERTAVGFDLVVATDVMYVAEAVPALLASLRALSEAPGAEVLLAHGRNRPAEAAFLEAAARHFDVRELPEAELHDVYRCIDVTVLRLTPLRDDGTKRCDEQRE